MDMGLKGRVAVIAGASKGIGKGVARSLAAEGCSLFLLARNGAELQVAADEIADEFGVSATPVICDVSDPDLVRDAAAAVRAKAERINILVTSVGTAIRRQDRTITWDDADWQADIDIKVTGVLRVLREFEGMIASDGTGRVVNITGASGVMTWMPALNYGMNNAAVIHATGYLAADLGARGITVNTVVPGIVGTEWREGWADGMSGQQARKDWLAQFCGGKGIVARRWAEVQEIGDAVTFLASDRAGYITGTRLVVDGGLSANIR